MRKFHFLGVLCWARGFYWSLNALCGGLKDICDCGLPRELFVIKNLGLDPSQNSIRIQQQPRSGSGFN